MLLKDMTAVIYGGSGAIGAATAGVFAREGARVYLAGRSGARLDKAAEEIRRSGGHAEIAEVDVLDAAATARHAAGIAAETGAIDIMLNATSFLHDQGSLIDDLTCDIFMEPIVLFTRSLFNTAKAVAPFMGGARGGVILTLTAPAARMTLSGHMGHIVACAAAESFSRSLAADLAPRQIRSLCIRPHAISDAPAAGSYTGDLFTPKADAMGISLDQWLAGAAQTTLLKRLPTLADVAETAAFLASPRAAAMTATTVNLTGGATLD